MAFLLSPIIHITTELLKYFIKFRLGDNAFTTIEGGIIDIGEGYFSQGIQKYLNKNKPIKLITSAFQFADDEFIQIVSDPVLKQTIISKPFHSLPRLQEFAKKIPNNLDDKLILNALVNQFKEDWPRRFSEEQFDQMARIYRNCLDKGLAMISEQILPTIYRKVDRIEGTTNEIKINTEQGLLFSEESNTLLHEIVKSLPPMGKSLDLNRIPMPDSPPLKPKLFLPRELLIDDLQKRMDLNPWIAFVDSQGKGKSQLAISLSRNFKQSYWITFRNRGIDSINHLHDQLASWLTQVTGKIDYWHLYMNGLSLVDLVNLLAKNIGKGSLLILDDLPNFVKSPGFYDELEIVSKILLENKIKILTTCQWPMPAYIKRNFSSQLLVTGCPTFTTDDILEFLALSGAPDKYKKDGIVTWIFILSKGLPCLVVSTIYWLIASNWDYSSTTIDDFINGEPIRETLEDNQKILLSKLGNPEKELIYRLSIIGDNFTKNTGIEIASLSPKISFPNEVLNNLIGPWIDQLDNGDLNVTPLLLQSGENNLPFEIKQSIHRLIVKNIAPNNVISASKASSFFAHLWQAHDYQDFARAIFELLVKVRTVEQARYFDWVTDLLVGIPWPEEIDLNWRIFIRSEQVRVSAMANKNYYKINLELDSLLKQANIQVNLLSMITAYLSTGLVNIELPLSITLPRSLALLQLSTLNPNPLEQFFNKDLINHLPITLWAQGIKAQSYEQIKNFLEELSKLESNTMSFICNSQDYLEACVHLIDRLVVLEAKKPSLEQDWFLVLSELDYLENLSIVKAYYPLQVSFDRTRAIIYSDFQNKPNEAILYLDNLNLSSNLEVSFIINYTKGCIFATDSQHNNAIECFQKAENISINHFKFYKFENAKFLLLEYSKNNEYIKSIQQTTHLILGLKQSSDNLQLDKWEKYEILAELSIVYWENKDFRKACASLFIYVQAIVEEQNFEDKRYKELFNKLGHCLGWYLSIAQNGNPITTTLSGDMYAPVKTGFFCIKNETLGNYESPYGYNKELLLLQYGLLCHTCGLNRLALRSFRTLFTLFTNNRIKSFIIVNKSFCDLSILEFLYGNNGNWINYYQNAIECLAAIHANLEKLNSDQQEINKTVDFSLIKDSDLQIAERQTLYLIVIPIFFGLIDENNANKQDKLAELANEIQRLQRSYNYDLDEWKCVFKYLSGLFTFTNLGNKLDYPGKRDKNIFEIIWYILVSTNKEMPLTDVLKMQLSAVLSLVEYGTLTSSISFYIGKIMYTFWQKVAKEQRFLIFSPDELLNNLAKFTLNQGANTIRKVINAVSFSVKISISEEYKEKLKTLK